MEYLLKNVVAAAHNMGYTVYTEPYKLNIIGIRDSKPINQDTFDDHIAYFYYDPSGNIAGKVCPATTDPSTYFLKNPVSAGGAAILKGGQYINSHKVGLHRGKYTALVQQGPLTVIRDNDRDGYTNLFNKMEVGIFGINIHRASRGKQNQAIIDKDSAGCQVFMNEPDFDDMMAMAKKSKDLYGNNFSYTLLDERDYIRARNTWLLGGIVGIGAITLSLYLYKKLSR